MRRNPKITGIIASLAISAIIALVLCSHYVKTKPILACNQTISQISHFFKNPTHAGLVAGIIGISYLLVGRELINGDKLRYGWDKNEPCGYSLFSHAFIAFNTTCKTSKHFSPIYIERKTVNNEASLTSGEKIQIAMVTSSAILTSPIITPIHKYPKAAIIMALATLILCIYAHYVHTKPMQDFNNTFLKAYHATTTFLANPLMLL